MLSSIIYVNILFILCFKTERHSNVVTSPGNGRVNLITSYFLVPTGQNFKIQNVYIYSNWPNARDKQENHTILSLSQEIKNKI